MIKAIGLAMIFLAVALVSLEERAFAAVYYMATNGSDSNSGSISAPWKTWVYGSSRLQPGDTLYVRGGIYYGQKSGSWSSPSGTSSAPITWKAYPGEAPIFDGQNAVAGNFMNVDSKNWLIFDGITIRNFVGPYSAFVAAIWVGNSTNIKIRNMTFQNLGTPGVQTQHAIYFSLSNQNVEASGNRISNVSGAGIHCYHTPALDGGRFYNNVIYNDGGWGIIVRAGNNIKIYNNTIYNSHWDIDVGSSTNTSVYNNIVSNPIIGLSSSIVADYNMFSAGTPNGGSHSFAGNPKYANPTGGDFHLSAGSSAIDRGTVTLAAPVDFDGKPRPQGLYYDIGAYEYGTVAAASPTPSPAPSPVSAALTSVVRINAGAAASYTDSRGQVWQPDADFAGGATADRGTSRTIANTADPRIFQTERYNMTGYAVPLANGTYTVRLSFAETSSVTGAGQRVFDVTLEGQKVLSAFDIYAQAGYATALIKTFTVSVTDGVLNIGFVAHTAAPEINGIEVLK